VTKRISFVIDIADASNASNVDFFKGGWNIDALVAAVAEADKTVDASIFVGKLEEAPESWAYVLFITEDELEKRSQVAAMKARFARTVVTDARFYIAGFVAERYGMVGGMDMGAGTVNLSGPGALFVKREIAKKLKWSTREGEDSDTFLRTNVKLPLAKLLLKYFEASLG
jgi:hypothetical protein